jgi:hypothetical protein
MQESEENRLEGNAKRHSEREITKGIEDEQSADEIYRKFHKVAILLQQTLSKYVTSLSVWEDCISFPSFLLIDNKNHPPINVALPVLRNRNSTIFFLDSIWAWLL